MANRRELKKDIRFISDQLLIDTIQLAEIVGEEKEEEILELFSDIAIFHNDLISRSNHPDGKDNPKIVSAYYKKIMVDLLNGCDNFYNRITALLPSE
jgi:hypothetical protein